jgi:small subunit ribosomal protein S9
MAEKKTYYIGTGRRKTSVARVRIIEGKGGLTINGKPLNVYFTEEKDRAAVMGPLLITELNNRLDVIIKVHGGGITGQAGAICQGMARAIKTMFAPPEERKSFTRNNVTVVKGYKVQAPAGTIAPNPAPASVSTAPEGSEESTAFGMAKKLRESGYLTRDSRMKERKKFGLRGARRGTQFSKR